MVSNFWLISIDDSSVTVALSVFQNGNYEIKSIGTSEIWENNYPDTFVTATDSSLASCATQINLPPESEPDAAAFVVPSHWIDQVGKITPDYKKFIEELCRKEDLKPLGFIAHDEAIVEQNSSNEGLPVSFILLYLTPASYDLSLVYLGKIKQRLHRQIDTSFTPLHLEEALVSLKTDSTLPPQVIVVGHYHQQLLDDLKNYTWIGKRTVETFLHFPDFSSQPFKEAVISYNQVITDQFQPEFKKPLDIPDQPVTEVVEVVDEIPEIEAEKLGFQPVIQDEPTPPPVAPVNHLPKFKFPKINFPSLPKIKLPPIRTVMFIPALSPLLLIVFVFFYKTDLTLLFTPINLTQSIDVTLDPAISQLTDIKKIPVTEKKIEVSLSLSSDTTGKKIVGDKSKGQINIFNKTDKIQNLPKGTVLTDSNGLKFLLSASVQVASSSINLDLGIITMGQTKATIEADDIGPEYNIAKDIKLVFKDFSSTSLEAKVDSPLTGGTKQEVAVVALADKQSLENQIGNAVATDIEQKKKNEIEGLSGLLTDTISISRNRNDFNREVGEEADQLTVKSDNTITAYLLDTSQKKAIINYFINQKPEYSGFNFNPDKFIFKFTPGKTANNSIGKLSFSGELTPNPDTTSIRRNLAGKSFSSLIKLISQNFPGVYKWNLSSNLPLIKQIILPLRWQNISIIIK